MDKAKEGLEETARVYASFVESFQGPPGASSLHPAARVALANQRIAGLNASLPPHLDASVGGRPGWGPPAAAAGGFRNGPPPFAGGREFTPASRPGIAPGFSQQPPAKADEPPPPLPKKSARGAKKRNIDAFLEEMKRRDEMREQHIDPDALPFQHQQQTPTPYLASPPLLQDTPRPQGPPLLPYAQFPIVPPLVPPPVGSFIGSHDVGDPSTTNLYVGNLPPEVTEEILAKEFAAYGDIASVKIMWPRTEEEHARRKNCGFVSYMDRKDAEDAVEKLRELVLFGSAIRVGWGKPVALPQTPLFECTDPTRKRATPSPPQASGANNVTQQSSNGEESVVEIPAGHPRFEIVLPSDPYLLFLINRMSLYVSKMGQNFEKLVMEREARDPRFAFLYVIQSPEHMYYRWKTYSLSQKDTMDKWRTLPFQMITGGPFWIPPPLTDLKVKNSSSSRSKTRSQSRSSSRSRSRSSDSSSSGSSRSRSRSKSRERKLAAKKTDKDKPKVKGWDVVKPPEGTEPIKPFAVPSYPTSYNTTPTSRSSSASAPRLRAADAERFEDMLRDLTTDRHAIAEGMAFALDHAEHAKEIVEIITDAMSILDTPVPKKIARLFLISDILYNSSAPVKNASAYRSAFQSSLARVFQHLTEKLATLEGRLAAQQMKDKVESVLNAWHAWSIFPAPLMATLEAWKETKRRKQPSESLLPAASAAIPVAASGENEQQAKKKAKSERVEVLGGVLSNTYDDSDEENAKGDDEDDEDVDGVPLVAEDTATARIAATTTTTTQATAMDDDENVDGVPLELPLASSSSSSSKKKKHSGLGGTMFADSDSDDDLDGAPLS